MASCTISKPGTDCRALRDVADSPCTICGKPIGYDTRYYSDERMGELMGYVHAHCAEGL